jgi:hypothetical protein
MSRYQHIVTTVARNTVHDVAFGQSADRTRLILSAMRNFSKDGNRLPIFLRHVNNVKLESILGCKLPAEAMRLVRVIDSPINAETDIQAIGLVTKSRQNVPQRKRILATRNGDKDFFLAAEHAIFLDEAFSLLGDPLEVVVFAEGQLVLAHIDGGFRTALLAFHGRCSPVRFCRKPGFSENPDFRVVIRQKSPRSI